MGRGLRRLVRTKPPHSLSCLAGLAGIGSESVPECATGGMGCSDTRGRGTARLGDRLDCRAVAAMADVRPRRR
jgi:hypothetical protein